MDRHPVPDIRSEWTDDTAFLRWHHFRAGPLARYPMVYAGRPGLGAPGPDFAREAETRVGPPGLLAYPFLSAARRAKVPETPHPDHLEWAVLAAAACVRVKDVAPAAGVPAGATVLETMGYPPAAPPGFSAAPPLLAGRAGKWPDLVWRAARDAAVTERYFSCLYDRGHQMAVRVRGVDHQVKVVPGHRWDLDGTAFVAAGRPVPDWLPAPPGPVYRADVMVVGKCPGDEEVATGRNFWGPSGRVLQDGLADAGFDAADWSDWYVTNLVKFQNPDRAADALPKALVDDCLPLLRVELAAVRPRVLLLLGREAVQAVLGKAFPLTAAVGRAFSLTYDTADDYRPAPGWEPPAGKGGAAQVAPHVPVPAAVDVVACVHPAAAARDPTKWYDEMMKGLRFFRTRVVDPAAAAPPAAAVNVPVAAPAEPDTGLDHRLIRTEADLRAWGAEVAAAGARVFAVDTEFHGLYPGEPPDRDGNPTAYLRMVQVSWAWKKAVGIVVTEPYGVERPIPEAAVVEVLTAVLRGPDRRLVCHYAAADLPWLRHLLGDWVVDQFQYPPDDPFPPPAGAAWVEGWEKTKTEGGFDTIFAAHACEETADLGLKAQALAHTTAGRYDAELNDWVEGYCRDGKRNGTGRSVAKADLDGFGMVDTDVLGRYAVFDADVTYRLYVYYNESQGPGLPGRLDRDRFGQSSRVPFWVTGRALAGFVEMRLAGFEVDKDRAGRMRVAYETKALELLAALRAAVRWPTFNPNSHHDCTALLYGEKYVQKFDKKTGERTYRLPVNYRLDEAGERVLVPAVDPATGAEVMRPEPLPTDQQPVTLGLTPYKTTGKRPQLWADAVRKAGPGGPGAPSTDKESLTVLGIRNKTAWALRDLKYLLQIGKAVLRPPVRDAAGNALDSLGDPTEAFEDMDHDRGLLSYVCADGRVRSNFSQTKETGRASSWQPPLQNLSKRREDDLNRIMGPDYPGPLRSVFVVTPEPRDRAVDPAALGPWLPFADEVADCGFDTDFVVIIEADYKGAELAGMAGQARDAAMIDHCRRMKLPEDDPDHYCIHSGVAIEAFQLRMPDGTAVRPSKGGIKAYGKAVGNPKIKVRDAAKPVVFGYAYGMGAASAQRKAKEEGADVSLEDAEALIAGLERKYPGLPGYFAQARQCSQDPGYLVNPFGRRRRFRQSADRKTVGEQEREAQNFPIQSLVADAVSRAMDYLYTYPDRRRLGYKMILQIHDAILFRTPVRSVPEVIDVVIPYCMEECVPIPVRDLYGNFLDAPPYRLASDRAVYLRWGVPVSAADADRIGLPHATPGGVKLVDAD